MWGELIKWGLVGAGAALAAAASWWALSRWDWLLHDVLAPWARRHDYRGVLNFLVEVDKAAVSLRRVGFRFTGRRGDRPLAGPVLVTEQTVREQDLPPELRRQGTHAWSFDTEGLERGIPG